MINLGRINKLKINRFVEFGAYLDAGNDVEILLPQKYITEDMEKDSEVEVFVYNDSEDRLVAVTEMPKAMVGDFALLRVAQVNPTGAFMDWGLPKEILVPFREQKVRMQPGRWYIVYIYVDDNSQRIVASAKLDKFLDNTIPEYKPNDTVDVLITRRTELGYKVIINHLHWGMIYHNQIFQEINIGEHHTAHVKGIRRDGKIDLVLGDHTKNRAMNIGEKIVEFLQINNGSMTINDKTDPEIIRRTFSCSKKDFKKAVGMLLKKKEISIHEEKIILN